MESYSRTGLFHRLVRRMAATRPMARLFGVIQEPIDHFVYRVSRGRLTASSWLGGLEVSMLTTTGARTGRPRTLPVLAPAHGREDGSRRVELRTQAESRLVPQPAREPARDDRVRRHPSRGGGPRAERTRARRGYRLAEEMFPAFTHYRRWAAVTETVADVHAAVVA